MIIIIFSTPESSIRFEDDLAHKKVGLLSSISMAESDLSTYIKVPYHPYHLNLILGNIHLKFYFVDRYVSKKDSTLKKS